MLNVFYYVAGKKIDTSILQTILTELPYLGAKKVHFIFNDKNYIQNDGVAMQSSLGPSSTNICMMSCEEQVITMLTSCLCNWKRYVNDTHAYFNSSEYSFYLRIMKGQTNNDPRCTCKKIKAQMKIK